ncbi:hypothetical protein EE612_045418 [Oryza sativa]|nr:hypothetical protein EE612_045418 [Oryza sativa]
MGSLLLPPWPLPSPASPSARLLLPELHSPARLAFPSSPSAARPPRRDGAYCPRAAPPHADAAAALMLAHAEAGDFASARSMWAQLLHSSAAPPPRRGAAPPGVRAARPVRRGAPRGAGALRARPRRGAGALPARRHLLRRRGGARPHGGRRPGDGPPRPPRRLRHRQRLRVPLRGVGHRAADGGRVPAAQGVAPPRLRRRHPRHGVRVHLPPQVLQARRVRHRRRPRPPCWRQPALEPLPPLLRRQLQDEVAAARVPGHGRRRVHAGPHHLQPPRRRLLQDVHVLGPPPHRRPHAPRRRRAGPRHARLLRRRLPGAPPRPQPQLRVRSVGRRRARRGHGRRRVRGVRQGGIPRELRGVARGHRRRAAVDVLQVARRLPEEAAQEKPNLLELLILEWNYSSD